MGTVFNKKELLVLLQDFHCLTGLRSAVFDSYGIEVLAYPPELPAYCRLIRSVPDGKTGCYLCDQAACRKATRQKQTIIYPCHAGLIEVITPVQIDGAVVGFLLLSHIVQGRRLQKRLAIMRYVIANLFVFLVEYQSPYIDNILR